MFSALNKAFAQLSDPAVRKILIRTALITAGLLFLSWMGMWWLLDAVPRDWVNWMPDWMVSALFAVTFLIAMAATATFLSPPLATLVMGFFLEEVAEAVERRHYPYLVAPRQQSLGEVLLVALRFIGMMLLLNLLLLPVYIFVPFPFSLIPFYGVNGYLVARENFEVVALRRLDRTATGTLFRDNLTRLWVPGAFFTFLMTLPLINLLAPVLAVATMVHLFHRLAGTQDGPQTGSTGAGPSSP